MNSYQDVLKKRKTLKAFTLVELIVVIAIIGILMSMVSLFMPGFIRDANLEAYNKNAQMAYTGMQNCLINWEIYQNDECVDADDLLTQAYSSKNVTYATISFVIVEGKVDKVISITSIYDNDTSTTTKVAIADDITRLPTPAPGGDGLTATNATDTKAEDVYKKLVTQIESNFGKMIDGIFLVFIDYENYLVDSVVYYPIMDNVSDFTFFVDKMNWVTSSPATDKAKIFMGCYDYDNQLDFYKKDKTKTGGYYPMASSVGTAYVHPAPPPVVPATPDPDEITET